jgi:hypothetical protein
MRWITTLRGTRLAVLQAITITTPVSTPRLASKPKDTKSFGSREWRTLGRRFLAAFGIGALPVGIFGPLAPDWWEGNWWPVGVATAAALLWALFGLRHRDPEHVYSRSNVTIRLVIGDLFEQNESAVVGFTTTFDTSMPDVIAPKSLQGVFADRIYGGSQKRLDSDLDTELANRTPAGSIEKPGKTIRYPLGTVVVLPGQANQFFYGIAYTEMSTQNVAQGSIQGVLDGLNNCWDEIDAHGNGNAICVPLIGQGQSRVPELTPEISIRLIAFSFLLRSKKSRFASELRIVVHPNERHKIDYPEFQAFLSSLDA